MARHPSSAAHPRCFPIKLLSNLEGGERLELSKAGFKVQCVYQFRHPPAIRSESFLGMAILWLLSSRVSPTLRTNHLSARFRHQTLCAGIEPTSCCYFAMFGAHQGIRTLKIRILNPTRRPVPSSGHCLVLDLRLELRYPIVLSDGGLPISISQAFVWRLR